MDSEYVYYPLSVTEQQIAKNGIEVYPNPANRSLSVVFPENVAQNVVEIQVVDIMGRGVLGKQEYAVDGKKRVTLDIMNLQPASYQMIVNTGKDVYTKQFVKTGQ